ncbi:MAG: carbohydrate kinase family protein [Firmicutes bacterium]|nr:carbohydrate kinase family protein [Bacillota bacterium]
MEQRSKKVIACAGTAIVDCLVKGYSSIPASKTNYGAERIELKAGGEAVNQSVALSKLGLLPRTVCFLGNDEASGILSGTLSAAGADLSYVSRPEGVQTPVSVIFVNKDGSRRSVTRRTAYRFHPEADMRWMEGCSAVSLCSLFRAPFDDPKGLLAVLHEAKGRGLTIYADTKLPYQEAFSLDDFGDCLPLIDYIFPNEKEAAFLSGREDPLEAADVFLRYGVHHVIVKLGERGCLYRSGQALLKLSALPVEAVDSTGAGDSFIAGFITMREEGAGILESLRFANACGAMAATKVGASEGIESREQVMKALSPQ